MSGKVPLSQTVMFFLFRKDVTLYVPVLIYIIFFTSLKRVFPLSVGLSSTAAPPCIGDRGHHARTASF